MKVSFHKKRDGRIVMTITRSDGSSTWAVLQAGLEIHDLAHIAVEGTLDLRDAFFGTVEKGAEIADFEDKAKQPKITTEAKQVEHLVLLLLIEQQQGSLGSDFMQQYHDILREHNLPILPMLDEVSLEEIRSQLTKSVQDLSELKVGQALVFE